MYNNDSVLSIFYFLMKGLFSIIVLVTANSLQAEKYAGEFMNLAVGVKAYSMGSAFTPHPDDGSAIYWNPAGMQNLNKIDTELMHSEEYKGNLKYDTFSFVFPYTEKSRFGFLLTRIGISDIPYTKLDDNNEPYIYKKVSNADYVTYLSFSRMLTNRMNFGFNTKLIYRKIGDYSAFGIGSDIGLQYNFAKRINAGLNLRDFFYTQIFWDNGTKETITPNLWTGLSIVVPFPIAKFDMILNCQADINFEGQKCTQLHWNKLGIDFHFGTELKIIKYFSLLAGLNRKYPSFGLQINYDKFRLNYSYQINTELENSQRISVGCAF